VEQGFALDRFLPYRLNRAAEAVGAGFGAIYRARHGLTRAEWRVLAMLGAFGRLAASEIAGRAGMHKTKVSRAVGALERRRWLERAADADDRRVERLTLTAAGREAFAELTALAEGYEASLNARFGPEAVAALDRGLAALEAALPPPARRG
jgi:DNA-binding MarR family transcriptional regulator